MKISRKGLECSTITKSVMLVSTLFVCMLILHHATSSNNNRLGTFFLSNFRFSSLYNGSSPDNLESPTTSLHHFNDSATQLVKDEYYELRKVLKAASTKDKTVILVFLNKAWAAPNSIFDLFLESFRIGNNTAWLLNHLMVVAVDYDAYVRCQASVLHCYRLNTNQSSELASQANFMTPEYLDMIWTRLSFCHTILSLGYNFLVTDTDIVWFRDPFPHLISDYDIQTSCDSYNGNEFDVDNYLNAGFMLVRSSNRTIKFYKFWISSRQTYPNLHEQNVFNKIKYDKFFKEVGLKVRFLDTDLFGGFCSPSKDFNKVCTMHANCCVGLHKKVADLKTTLEDWKMYVSSNGTANLPPSHWRVPYRCNRP